MNKALEHTFLAGLEAHKHKLLRICSVYAKDEEERNDLFQEALMNIWKSMPSFQSNAAIGTWMYRVTLNVCLNMQTKLAKKKQQFVNMDSVTLSQMGGQTASKEEHPRLIQLRSCLKNLNEADRGIMTL